MLTATNNSGRSTAFNLKTVGINGLSVLGIKQQIAKLSPTCNHFVGNIDQIQNFNWTGNIFCSTVNYVSNTMYCIFFSFFIPQSPVN